MVTLICAEHLHFGCLLAVTSQSFETFCEDFSTLLCEALPKTEFAKLRQKAFNILVSSVESVVVSRSHIDCVRDFSKISFTQVFHDLFPLRMSTKMETRNSSAWAANP